MKSGWLDSLLSVGLLDSLSWLAPPCLSLAMCLVMLNPGWTNAQGL